MVDEIILVEDWLIRKVRMILKDNRNNLFFQCDLSKSHHLDDIYVSHASDPESDVNISTTIDTIVSLVLRLFRDGAMSTVSGQNTDNCPVWPTENTDRLVLFSMNRSQNVPFAKIVVQI